jgi:Predicted DNA alkylation repair enzyme
MKAGYGLEDVREKILSMADGSYREFQVRLLPEVKNYIGVRLPALRKLAKEIAREEGGSYLEEALDREPEKELFEEIMLQGMVIGYMKGDISDIFSYTERFLPKIDNWSVCDSFCSGYKHAVKCREQVWEWLEQFLLSDREFTVRFALVLLLNYYIDDVYLERLFFIFDHVRHDGYYVRMAAAWALSMCYIRYPEETMRYLGESRLDSFTYNKALQKIMESRCITAQQRETIRGMKRTGGL